MRAGGEAGEQACGMWSRDNAMRKARGRLLLAGSEPAVGVEVRGAAAESGHGGTEREAALEAALQVCLCARAYTHHAHALRVRARTFTHRPMLSRSRSRPRSLSGGDGAA